MTKTQANNSSFDNTSPRHEVAALQTNWTDRKPQKWKLLRCGRTLRAICIGALALAAASGLWFGNLQVTGNFHVIAAGIAYRSAQLGPQALGKIIQLYHIRSVINLRGKSTKANWYRAEIAVSKVLSVDHYDIGMSANESVGRRQMSDLLAVMVAAKKPFLVHCQGGADRSGLAAALYAYAALGESATEASEQLSWQYGHFPYLWSRTGAMDSSFRTFVSEPNHLAAAPSNGNLAPAVADGLASGPAASGDRD